MEYEDSDIQAAEIAKEAGTEWKLEGLDSPVQELAIIRGGWIMLHLKQSVRNSVVAPIVIARLNAAEEAIRYYCHEACDWKGEPVEGCGCCPFGPYRRSQKGPDDEGKSRQA